jgi:hypothetical protein
MLKLCSRLLQHTQIIPTATNVFLDFCGGAGGARMVAIYMHHVVYPADDLQICYAQLFCILANARARNYFRTLNGTFNNQLCDNLRGDSCCKRQQSTSTWKAETYPRRTYQDFLLFNGCEPVLFVLHSCRRDLPQAPANDDFGLGPSTCCSYEIRNDTEKTYSTRKYTIFQNQTWMETMC